MVNLDSCKLLFKLFNLSFVETIHLFYSQIQCFNFLVFVGNLSFKLSFLSHHLFGIDGFGLNSLDVFDLSHGDFRCLVLDLFFMKHNQILQLLMLSFVLDFEFIESVVILFSEFELGMDFFGELFSDVSEKGPEVISLSCIGCKGILKFCSEGLNVGLIKL